MKLMAEISKTSKKQCLQKHITDLDLFQCPRKKKYIYISEGSTDITKSDIHTLIHMFNFKEL